MWERRLPWHVGTPAVSDQAWSCCHVLPDLLRPTCVCGMVQGTCGVHMCTAQRSGLLPYPRRCCCCCSEWPCLSATHAACNQSCHPPDSYPQCHMHVSCRQAGCPRKAVLCHLCIRRCRHQGCAPLGADRPGNCAAATDVSSRVPPLVLRAEHVAWARGGLALRLLRQVQRRVVHAHHAHFQFWDAFCNLQAAAAVPAPTPTAACAAAPLTIAAAA